MITTFHYKSFGSSGIILNKNIFKFFRRKLLPLANATKGSSEKELDLACKIMVTLERTISVVYRNGNQSTVG